MRWLLFFCSLFAFPVLAAPVAPNAADSIVVPLTVTVSARLTKTNFSADEPVNVEVTLLNTGAKTVSLGGSVFEMSAFQFDLMRVGGQKIALTAFGRELTEPPRWISDNPSLSLAPGQERRTTFALRRMSDIGAGGSFSLSISRGFATSSALPLQFSLAFPSPPAAAPLFPSRATLLLALNQLNRREKDFGEIEAFRVCEDGSLAPQLNPAAVVPQDSSSLIADSTGQKVYVTREDAVQAFSV